MTLNAHWISIPSPYFLRWVIQHGCSSRSLRRRFTQLRVFRLSFISQTSSLAGSSDKLFTVTFRVITMQHTSKGIPGCLLVYTWPQLVLRPVSVSGYPLGAHSRSAGQVKVQYVFFSWTLGTSASDVKSRYLYPKHIILATLGNIYISVLSL